MNIELCICLSVRGVFTGLNLSFSQIASNSETERKREWDEYDGGLT